MPTSLPLLAVLVVAAQLAAALPEVSVVPPAPASSPLRFLALGDSYTIGEAVPQAERWPEQLVVLLRAAGVTIDEPVVIARTGWTTDELNAGIDAATPSGTFDLVTLLIGVNDQYRGRTVEDYRPRFGALLARARGFAGGDASRVIVASIPDWSVTPYAEGRDRAAIAGQINAFNEAASEAARKAGASWIDFTTASRRAATEPTLTASDGLHPSGPLHAEWARSVLPVAREILRRRAGG